jgi:hypothetical protein
MKNEPTKAPEAQLLDLLKQVLPKATHDPQGGAGLSRLMEKSRTADDADERGWANSTSSL